MIYIGNLDMNLPQVVLMLTEEVVCPGSSVNSRFLPVLVPVLFLLDGFLCSRGLDVHPHHRQLTSGLHFLLPPLHIVIFFAFLLQGPNEGSEPHEVFLVILFSFGMYFSQVCV